MKSNKNRLLVAETEAIPSYGFCLLVFCSRLAMFVVLGFFGKVRYKFRFVQSAFWFKFIRKKPNLPFLSYCVTLAFLADLVICE